MGKTDGLRSNEGVKERSGFVNTTNGDTVPCAVTKSRVSKVVEEKAKTPYT
jgi:hypothetical protein